MTSETQSTVLRRKAIWQNLIMQNLTSVPKTELEHSIALRKSLTKNTHSTKTLDLKSSDSKGQRPNGPENIAVQPRKTNHETCKSFIESPYGPTSGCFKVDEPSTKSFITPMVHTKKEHGDKNGTIIKRKYPPNKEHRSMRPNIHFDTWRKEEKSLTKSEIFFKGIYGPKYSIQKDFHRIVPPMIPDFMVKIETLTDGHSPVVLGRGSFGRVVKAKLTENQESLVVKEVFDSKHGTDAIFREARALLYLERTGCVPVCYGVVSEVGGGVFGVLQECVGNGLNLETYLWFARSEKDPLVLLDIAKQLTEGLRDIHEMEIIVNDVKTNNILVDKSSPIPTIKFCDMGLATFKIGKTFKFTEDADQFIYLAPEVRAGEVSTYKSDTYSMGRVLDHIQDFGEMVCLYPATEKCSVEDPRWRINADELANSVSFIYDQQLVDLTRTNHTTHNSTERTGDKIKPTIRSQNLSTQTQSCREAKLSSCDGESCPRGVLHSPACVRLEDHKPKFPYARLEDFIKPKIIYPPSPKSRLAYDADDEVECFGLVKSKQRCHDHGPGETTKSHSSNSIANAYSTSPGSLLSDVSPVRGSPENRRKKLSKARHLNSQTRNKTKAHHGKDGSRNEAVVEEITLANLNGHSQPSVIHVLVCLIFITLFKMVTFLFL